MPPQLLASEHDKENLRSLEDLELNDSMVLVDCCFEYGVGPNDETIKISLMRSSSEGTVCMEVVIDNSTSSIIGNIDFDIWDDDGSILANGAAVYSAFVDPDYRAMGLALSSYKLLHNNFSLISDCEQTYDGAAFWKLKLSQESDIAVSVVITPEDTLPYKASNCHGFIIYDGTQTSDEPIIWGKEYFSDPAPSFLNVHQIENRKDVRLLAVKK